MEKKVRKNKIGPATIHEPEEDPAPVSFVIRTRASNKPPPKQKRKPARDEICEKITSLTEALAVTTATIEDMKKIISATGPPTASPTPPTPAPPPPATPATPPPPPIDAVEEKSSQNIKQLKIRRC